MGICLIASSCSSNDPVVLSSDAQIQAWLDTAGIQGIRDESTGIYYYAIQENQAGATLSQGSIAGIYYDLYDLQDNLIASHQRSNGDSLIFKVGASAVYPVGVDFGVAQMRLGEIYGFILPPEQGYSELNNPSISNQLIARLEISLVSISQEVDLAVTEDAGIRAYITDNELDDLTLNPIDSTLFFNSGIAIKRRRRGIEDRPSPGDTISVSYTGRFIDDVSFVGQSSFTWVFGSGEPRPLMAGFEETVSRMLVNEQVLALIPSAQGYRESALIIPDFIAQDLLDDQIIPDYVVQVPPYSTLLMELTRVN
ncbi:MAG: FKBP-type peptidyl-prolyl cis-trans isomerase [Ekhidna sp.]|nr:FKBP-type peptidyl-prolyl cis-trans isomerase [Ekhidna sp.]